MKPLIFLITLVFSGSTFADQFKGKATDDRQPESLINSLRIVELENWRLIYACDAGDDYFAVRVDPDGDLLIATYAKTPVPADAKRNVLVTGTETGRSIADYSKDKVNVTTASVKYKSNSKLGPLTLSRSATIALDTGWIVPITENPPPRFRL